MLNKPFSVALLFAAASLISHGATPGAVSIDAAVEKHAINKTAMGAGLVYSWHADSMFTDGEVAHIINDIGIGALRWPGGTVSTFYHWDDLNGQGWMDHWNPAYDTANDQPPENYQDLDEYLALINETGAEIILGINMSSGKAWNREADGIAEASNLVAYCQSQGHDVDYIFFDNESFQHGNNYNNTGPGWTATTYAQSFNLYAAAVKTIYPNAKLIANVLNNVTAASIQADIRTILSIAGSNIDLIDLHYYWEWSNASWPLWKSQTPMKRTGTSQSYQDTIQTANSLFSSSGFPNIRAVVMEWNIGLDGPWATDPDHNNFKTALMQTEMQMQLLQAEVNIGLLFALENILRDPTGEQNVIRNGQPNSTALWMWLFSKLTEKTVVQSSSPITGVYILSAKSAQGEMVTYLLNKTDTDYTIEFNLSNYTVNEVSEAWRFHDAGTGKASLLPISLSEISGTQRTELLANTLNMIGFNYSAMDTPTQSNIEASPTEPIPDGILIGWHSSAGPADLSSPGVSGTLFEGSLVEVDESAGSSDGTFGLAIPGAMTAKSAFEVRANESSDTLSFEIKNESGLPLRLDTIHFDYAPWWPASPRDVALVYSYGDLPGATNQTPIQSIAGIQESGSLLADYSDFDWPLTNLPSQVLSHGESAIFSLTASTASNSFTSGAFDNIAVSGESVTNGVDSVLIAWRGQTGKSYTVMKSSNLLSNDWTSAGDILIGQPGDMSAPVDLEIPGFYRLEITP